MKIENWEFDRSEFKIKKKTPDNRILNNIARNKQEEYYN
jgi:hypothetical protein